MAPGEELKHKLAALTVSVNALRAAAIFEKAALAETCMTLTLELLGAMVQRIEKLERRRIE